MRETAKTHARIDRYFEAFEAGTLKPELCNKKIQDLNARLEELDAEQRELEGRRKRLALPAIDKEMLSVGFSAGPVIFFVEQARAAEQLDELLVVAVNVSHGDDPLHAAPGVLRAGSSGDREENDEGKKKQTERRASAEAWLQRRFCQRRNHTSPYQDGVPLFGVQGSEPVPVNGYRSGSVRAGVSKLHRTARGSRRPREDP